jgi:hypothetical protein
MMWAGHAKRMGGGEKCRQLFNLETWRENPITRRRHGERENNKMDRNLQHIGGGYLNIRVWFTVNTSITSTERIKTIYEMKGILWKIIPW